MARHDPHRVTVRSGLLAGYSADEHVRAVADRRSLTFHRHGAALGDIAADIQRTVIYFHPHLFGLDGPEHHLGTNLQFVADGKFLLQWGEPGARPGQLTLAQSMAVDEEDRIWVADACNHRIQIFDTEGRLLGLWGSQGGQPGQLYYPYDLVLSPDGLVYVAEFGNHRVQRFTHDGQSRGCWGTYGRQEGQLTDPWALVLDSRGRIHVLDTKNHRVQKVRV